MAHILNQSNRQESNLRVSLEKSGASPLGHGSVARQSRPLELNQLLRVFSAALLPS
jgi:hypothetical protein